MGNVEGALISYACLHSSVFYETTTVLEAVDVCVKACFVLGVSFPEPAHSSWLFLQKAIYGLSSKYDKIPSRVHELMSEIELR